MRKITFDIETRNTFQDVGSDKAVDLDISLLCIHDSKTDEYDTFMHDDLDRLWPILDQGDLTSIKSLDILKEIKNSLGKRIKLDTVAEATLGTNKSGEGLDAVKWWNNGEIEKIKKYCLDDVRITKEIYEYALKHGKLKYKDRITSEIKEIKLDTSNWEEREKNTSTQSLF